MDTERASLEIQAAYRAEAQPAEPDGRLRARDHEAGRLRSAAKGARNGLSLLNDSDMRQLESAIEAANQKIQQLKEGSKSTLVSL
ncbi:hypothetical protein P4110_00015 [Pseudomonas aeruginosa]|nr:hypothetical protein [Pseudomonas aeruginosa]